MPRTGRSQGRPGTGVFAKDWETSHAFVVRKTFTAHARIWLPPAKTQINDDLSYDPPANVDPVYDGDCRVQALNAADTVKALGDETIASAGYLLVLDRAADRLVRGAVVQITESTDPTLLDAGRRLYVERIDRGSVRWERDVYCLDQLTKGNQA